jgi:hypothetical protein
MASSDWCVRSVPDYKKAAHKAAKGRGGNGGSKRVPAGTTITEPRCKVCQHAQRKIIDRYLARGHAYRELERVFGIDRRSISNHDQKHLNINDAAMRLAVREEVEDQEALEEGVQGFLKHRLYLKTALTNALEAITTGDITVEPRDALAIIEKLENIDQKSYEVQMTQMKIELDAFLRAMKENVSSDVWDRIMRRAEAIASRSEQILKGDYQIEADDVIEEP